MRWSPQLLLLLAFSEHRFAPSIEAVAQLCWGFIAPLSHQPALWKEIDEMHLFGVCTKEQILLNCIYSYAAFTGVPASRGTCAFL